MGHLVSDDDTDGAVVRGIVGIEVEERRLQDTRRETNLVHAGAVVSIDDMRRHAPFFPVDGLVDFVAIILGVEGVCPKGIHEVRVLLDLQTGVIPPFIGVTDFHAHGIEFSMGLFFGDISHPFQVLDSMSQCFFKVSDQGDHPVLGIRWEIFINVHFAQGHTHGASSHIKNSLPARLHLFLARHGLSVEVEIGVDEIGAEERRGTPEDIPAKIGLPILHGNGMHQVVDLLKEVGLADVEVADVIDAQTIEVGVPVEAAANA